MQPLRLVAGSCRRAGLGGAASEDTMATPAYELTVTHVEHYTPQYFRIRCERPEGFQFRAGQFVMIGLNDEQGTPIMRAYSVCSPVWDEELEFYSIIIPDGALTSRLQHIRVGDTLLMAAKAVGTLTLQHIRVHTPSEAAAGRRLYMLSTGTGIAPFISLIRDPDTYEAFDEVILTHTCRQVADLRYGIERVADAKDCPLVGEEATEKLRLYSSATREPCTYEGRITDLISSGKLFTDLGPRYKERPGGYIRILKCGFRPGDNAPMAYVELVDRPAASQSEDA